MFGLFKNTYDYFEWHDLVSVSVSAVKENLVRKIAGEEYPLLEGKEQETAKDNEVIHYEIHEVDEI